MGIEISLEVTARLYEAFPHVQCMKAAEGSCEKVSAYVRVLGPDFAVMGGDDGLILPFMSCGAQGLISVASNLYVQPLVELVAAANRGAITPMRKRFSSNICLCFRPYLSSPTRCRSNMPFIKSRLDAIRERAFATL